MCLAQVYYTLSLVGIEPRTFRFGFRRSTTRSPRSIKINKKNKTTKTVIHVIHVINLIDLCIRRFSCTTVSLPWVTFRNINYLVIELPACALQSSSQNFCQEKLIEPPHGNNLHRRIQRTNNLHRRIQRRRSASQ